MISLRDSTADPIQVIRALELQPHPEGGHYRETWRDMPTDGGRGAGTAILFLLRDGERSHWHRVDAAELWIWQGGAAMRLEIAGQAARLIGPDLGSGGSLQAVVPAHSWQAAESLGAWTLCTCVVAPAFCFEGFELAPFGWVPGDPVSTDR